MSGGGGTTTSNSSSTVPPDVLAEYNQVTQQANQVAAAPLNQYGGQTVAGFTPDEQQAMQTIQGSQGITQPYTTAAQGLVNQSTQAINPNTVTAANIQNYQSPYTQSVLNSTMAAENNQDAQQQQQVEGNSISSGAWGGDRSAVAQGILAGQQAIANNATNAGIENAGYSQALSEANTQQQAATQAQEATQGLQAQGALATNQLGSSALNNMLTGANAQLASGQIQQQLAQSELNVPYEQFLQSQAYPFQTTGWLGNIAEGIGSNEGGTSTSSTQQPSEGLFRRGGPVKGDGIIRHYRRGGIMPPKRLADGGTSDYYNPASGAPQYIPIVTDADLSNPLAGQTAYDNELAQYNTYTAANAAPAVAAPAATFQNSGSVAPTYAQWAQANGGTTGAGKSGIAYTGGNVAGLNSQQQSDLNSIYSGKYRKGGIVARHLDSGGPSDDTDYYQNDVYGNAGVGPGNTLNPAMFSAQEQVESGGDPNAVSPAGAKGVAQVMDGTNADPGYGVMPARDNSPEERERVGRDYSAAMIQKYHDQNFGPYSGTDLGLMAYNWGPGNVDKLLSGDIDPSQIPEETKAYPGKVLDSMDPAAYSSTISTGPDGLPVGSSGASMGSDAPPPTPPSNAQTATGVVPPQNAPKHEANPWLAVAAGVLGTLAGRSRNPLVDIGQGGLIGLNNYAAQETEALKQNYDEGTVANNAQKLSQDAAQAKAQLAEEHLKNANDQQYKQDILDQGKYVATPMGDILNTKEGTLTSGPLSQGNKTPAVDASGQPLTGEAYLATLSPQRATLAKGIASGDIPWPTGFALKNPQMMQAMVDARTYDPQANSSRAGAVKAFNYGQQGNTMRAMDVATAHLDTLGKLADAMNNNDTKAINYLSNVWQKQTGQPAPTNFNALKPIVAGEIVKATTGSQGALGDRKSIEDGISNSSGPAILKGAIDTYRTAMIGQLSGLQQQYANSTGRSDFMSKLRPETQAVLSGASHPEFQPRQVRLGNKVATVSTPQELQEATQQGWK